jgi:hypothetical protein
MPVIETTPEEDAAVDAAIEALRPFTHDRDYVAPRIVANARQIAAEHAPGDPQRETVIIAYMLDLLGLSETEPSVSEVRTEPPGFRRASEVREMLAILRRGEALTSERQKIIEIGKRLNASGGFSAMVATAQELRRQFPSGEGGEDGWHPAEIDYAWNGIGQWLA